MQNPQASAPSGQKGDEPGHEPLPGALQWVRRILPVVFLLLMVALSWRELRTINIHALRASVHAVPFSTLLALQLFGIVGVLAMTLYDWRLCHWMEIPLPFRRLLRYTWVANTFNNVLGVSGLAGSGIRFLLLAREGVAPKTAAVYSGTLLLSVAVGLSVLVWPVLLFGGGAVAAIPAPQWLIHLVLLLIAAFLPLYLLLTGNSFLHQRLFRMPPTLGPGRQAQLIVISTVDWLLAMTVAWSCLWVGGAQVELLAFVVPFCLAATLGVFSLIPGGLGVFDATLLLTLSSLQLPSEAVLTGILLFRLVYYVVPWIIALYVGAGLLVTRDNALLARLARTWQENILLSLIRLPLSLLSALGVRVMGYLTFGAGAILLVSAAFPTLKDRLAVLHRYVPLPAIEASHLLSVGMGVLLIALSRGIADQVRGAYRLAMVLLLGGALLSLAKGVDFEETVALGVIAGLLWMRRHDFYRTSYPLLSVHSIYWLSALLVAITGYALLGAWVHGDQLFHQSLWLHFAPGLEAPRFLRSVLFAVLVALAFMAWTLFRMPGPRLALPDRAALQQARQSLERNGGNNFAHLMFMGDKYLFPSSDQRALIQFARIRDRLVALGDPNGDPESLDKAIMEFRVFADRYDLAPVFYEVAEQHMHRYHDNGFSLFKIGEMAYVETSTFTLTGKRSENLRHSVKRAQRDGATFELLEHPQSEATWEELKAISDAWLNTRGAAEKHFSIGNFSRDYLSWTPLAAVRCGARLVAFANLAPNYGPPEEITIDLMRHLPDAPPGTMDLLFSSLIAYAREHGYAYFNLGIAPLSGVGQTRYARPDEKVARLAYEYGNRYYNYKGLRSFKDKFNPEWRSVYIAYPVFTPLPGLLVDIAALIAGGYRRILFKSI